MANENNSTRIYLLRLIPDATPTHFHNDKVECRIRRQQKETVARFLLSRFPNERSVVVCDSNEQAFNLPLASDENALKNFQNGTINQLLFDKLPGGDFNPQQPVNVIIISSDLTEHQLQEGLDNLLKNPFVTIFLLFHIRTRDEWMLSSTLEGIDSTLLAMQDIPVADESDPERPAEDDDFDRVKCYSLPYNNADAEYRFMWNDGFNGVYFSISQNGKKLEDGYRYDTTLLEQLNKEFTKIAPSKKLVNLISEAFDSTEDYDVITKK